MLLEQMQPWSSPDHDTYLTALGAMFEQITQLSMDYGNDGDPDYVPGWGALLDVDLCPTEFLPYLAQFNGTVVPSGADDATARAIIRAEAGMQRGTPAAMKAAALRNLTGAHPLLVFLE